MKTIIAGERRWPRTMHGSEGAFRETIEYADPYDSHRFPFCRHTLYASLLITAIVIVLSAASVFCAYWMI